LRVAAGLANGCDPQGLPDSVRQELGASQCVLVSLPPSQSGALEVLQRWSPLLQVAVGPTTLERAAERSPMFGAWMASAARGPAAARVPSPRPAAVSGAGALDAVLYVVEARTSTADDVMLRRCAAQLAPAPVHRIVWGATLQDAAVPGAWARVPRCTPCSGLRQPLSAVDPDHPSARVYESLAQSLLAGLGSKAGPHG
jgi:hypothetical protein